MSVYVDEVRRWPTKIRCFQAGSAHLTADTLEELHELARAIGLRRAWFQDKRVPHYDLTPSRREAALRAGAVFVSAKEQARGRAAARAAAHEAKASTIRALSPAADGHIEALERARDAAVRRIDDWVAQLDALDPDGSTNNEDIYDELVKLREALAVRNPTLFIRKGPAIGFSTIETLRDIRMFSTMDEFEDAMGWRPRRPMPPPPPLRLVRVATSDAQDPDGATSNDLCPGSRGTFDHVRAASRGARPWERACGICGHLGEPA